MNVSNCVLTFEVGTERQTVCVYICNIYIYLCIYWPTLNIIQT